MTEITLCTGNRAVCYGAIDAGCRHFFGYPITPQNDIPEYMSAELPRMGGIYKQTESEVSSINMVYGAVAAGVRAMTSTSSPGFSLMQEAVSGIAAAELPAVVVDVQRGGPGLGTTQTAQMDYFQATKGGGHGGYRQIVLAPHSVQDDSLAPAGLAAQGDVVRVQLKIPRHRVVAVGHQDRVARFDLVGRAKQTLDRGNSDHLARGPR